MEVSGNMKSVYDKTYWIHGETPVNAENLNKIEDAIEELYSTSVEVSQLVGKGGIDINFNDEQEIIVSTDPLELNKLVNHKEYKAGDGIKLSKTPLPHHFGKLGHHHLLDCDTYFDETIDGEPVHKHYPKEHEATIISVDSDYVNDIVKHPKYEGKNGITVSVKDLISKHNHNHFDIHVGNENSDEDVDDIKKPKELPTYELSADIDYINDNIKHPSYYGIKGVKILYPNVETIFPEHGFDEKSKVVLLDEDYINDKVIDADKLAKKLELSPIVSYAEGEGIKIDEEIITPGPIGGDNVVSPNTELGDRTIEEYLDSSIPDPAVKTEPDKVTRVIKVDEDYLIDKVLEHSPTLEVTKGLTLDETLKIDEEKDSVTGIHRVLGINPDELKEELQLPPQATISTTDGINCSIQENGEDNVINYELSLDANEVKRLISYSEHPIIKVGKGITMESSKVVENESERDVLTFNVDADYINEIVKHNKYKFTGGYFDYKDSNDGELTGTISLNEAKLIETIKGLIEKYR